MPTRTALIPADVPSDLQVVFPGSGRGSKLSAAKRLRGGANTEVQRAGDGPSGDRSGAPFGEFSADGFFSGWDYQDLGLGRWPIGLGGCH